jgi:hypothetical protein
VELEDTRKNKNPEDPTTNDENMDELLEAFRFPGSQGTNKCRIPVDILVGAGGADSPIIDQAGIETKLFKGGMSIGVTANFINANKEDERTLPEFTCSKVYNQDFFGRLEEKYMLESENLVYFHGSFTHYLVLTPKKQSLLKKGVFKRDLGAAGLCTDKKNVDFEKLKQLAREVADELNIPSTVEWARSQKGVEDVAIFDFSARKVAAQPATRLETNGSQCVVALAGDSLLEPFWPMGTGANKAVLASLDTAWMLMAYGIDPKNWKKALAMRKACFNAMKNALPSNLPTPGNPIANLDPTQRYHKKDMGIS